MNVSTLWPLAIERDGEYSGEVMEEAAEAGDAEAIVTMSIAERMWNEDAIDAAGKVELFGDDLPVKGLHTYIGELDVILDSIAGILHRNGQEHLIVTSFSD